MKRLLFSTLSLTGLLLSGCEYSYHEFNDKMTVDQTLVYPISATGTIEQNAFLKMDDMVRELKVNKPNAKIKKVSLESMSVSIDENPDNKADNLRILSLVVNDDILNKNLIKENNIDVNSTSAKVANNVLLVKGVEGVNEFLTTLLRSLQPSFVSVSVKLRGTTIPSATRASLTLRVKLKYDIEYTYCESLPNDLYGEGSTYDCF